MLLLFKHINYHRCAQTAISTFAWPLLPGNTSITFIYSPPRETFVHKIALSALLSFFLLYLCNWTWNFLITKAHESTKNGQVFPFKSKFSWKSYFSFTHSKSLSNMYIMNLLCRPFVQTSKKSSWIIFRSWKVESFWEIRMTFLKNCFSLKMGSCIDKKWMNAKSGEGASRKIHGKSNQ